MRSTKGTRVDRRRLRDLSLRDVMVLESQISSIKRLVELRAVARMSGLRGDFQNRIIWMISVERKLLKLNCDLRLLLLMRYGYDMTLVECARAKKRSIRWVSYTMSAAHRALLDMPGT